MILPAWLLAIRVTEGNYSSDQAKPFIECTSWPYGIARASEHGYSCDCNRFSIIRWLKNSCSFGLRPYYAENTGSHPNPEVKLHQARLVLGWGTTLEPRVLQAFSLLRTLHKQAFSLLRTLHSRMIALLLYHDQGIYLG